MNDSSYTVERFGIFHAPKGTKLSIQVAQPWLEYYMILYRAGEPAFYKKEFSKLLSVVNPFLQQYGFTPKNPIFFAEQLKKRFEQFSMSTSMGRFYSKASFYRVIYEIYEELYDGNILVYQQDHLVMAKYYIDAHYSEAVSIQELSGILGVSAGHLRRTFKNRYGYSPQEYITKLRIEAVKKYIFILI